MSDLAFNGSIYCQTCLDSLQRLAKVFVIDEDSVQVLHHPTTASLRNAATDNCRFCYVFWSQFNAAEQRVIEEYDETMIQDSSISLPDVSDQSGPAYVVRKELLQKYATLCLLGRGERFLAKDSGQLNGFLTFCIFLSFERKLPSSSSRTDTSIFLLEPLVSYGILGK